MEPPESLSTTAFGLDIRSETPLIFLGQASSTPTGRPLVISTNAGDTKDLGWPLAAELVCDERHADGSVIFRIEAHPESGYRISGPEYGAHLLSADGRRLTCFPEGRPDDAWQRLLIAQVLPFASLLQGLEIFHASAVVMGSTGVAFLGPSHAGKTSLALELCRRGASFLADDVLALEPSKEALVAHCGTSIAGVARADSARRPEPHLVPDNAIVAVNEREHLVRIRSKYDRVQLGALFFLDRTTDEREGLHFDVVAEPQTLLTATFNFVLATPERLHRLLDVCALAAQLRVERIVLGIDTDTAKLAVAVEHRLSATA